jgi:hypothetical protein
MTDDYLYARAALERVKYNRTGIGALQRARTGGRSESAAGRPQPIIIFRIPYQAMRRIALPGIGGGYYYNRLAAECVAESRKETGSPQLSLVFGILWIFDNLVVLAVEAPFNPIYVKQQIINRFINAFYAGGFELAFNRILVGLRITEDTRPLSGNIEAWALPYHAEIGGCANAIHNIDTGAVGVLFLFDIVRIAERAVHICHELFL